LDGAQTNELLEESILDLVEDWLGKKSGWGRGKIIVCVPKLKKFQFTFAVTHAPLANKDINEKGPEKTENSGRERYSDYSGS